MLGHSPLASAPLAGSPEALAAITGTLAATEAGSDTFAGAGGVLVSGTLAATESGADSASISGAVLVSGALAATEAGNDNAVFTGSVLVSGTLDAAEAGADVAAFAGTAEQPGITGTLDATESGSDIAVFRSVIAFRPAGGGSGGGGYVRKQPKHVEDALDRFLESLDRALDKPKRKKKGRRVTPSTPPSVVIPIPATATPAQLFAAQRIAEEAQARLAAIDGEYAALAMAVAAYLERKAIEARQASEDDDILVLLLAA